MELTFDNLVNEITEQEYIYNSLMNGAKKSLGEDSEYYKYCKNKWEEFYGIALKFNFVSKLKR